MAGRNRLGFGRSSPVQRKSGPARDHTRIGDVSAPAFACLPDPERVFASRAQRFAELAPSHPLGPYLTFLSGLAGVQHQAQATLPSPPAPSPAEGPPLAAGRTSDNDFPPLLGWFLQQAASIEAPEEARQALARLRSLPGPARQALTDAVRAAAYPMDQLAECLYVAAAVQVHMTRLAASLDLAHLPHGSDGTCPACASPPVASMIVNWPNASRARYCICALCSTAWNFVRIKCTSCGSTGGIEYFVLEEQSRDVAVETCSHCHGYIKHLHQDRLPSVEPVADDIASFGLDLLVQQEGFRRLVANPLMVLPANS